MINQNPLCIDHIHLGGSLSSIGSTDFPVLIEDVGCRLGAVFRTRFGNVSHSHVTLFSGSGGGNRNPNHALVGSLFLHFLHIAENIVFFDKRASWIDPFEHDHLSLKIGEGRLFPLAIRESEIRRRLAWLDVSVKKSRQRHQKEK